MPVNMGDPRYEQGNNSSTTQSKADLVSMEVSEGPQGKSMFQNDDLTESNIYSHLLLIDDAHQLVPRVAGF